MTNTFFGEGIVVNEENAKGVIIKGIDVENIDNYNFLLNQNPTNDLKKLEKKTAFIGAELAYNLKLEVGDKINLMSSSFLTTPFGIFLNKKLFYCWNF